MGEFGTIGECNTAVQTLDGTMMNQSRIKVAPLVSQQVEVQGLGRGFATVCWGTQKMRGLDVDLPGCKKH